MGVCVRGGHRDHPPPRTVTSPAVASLGRGLTKARGRLGAGTGMGETPAPFPSSPLSAAPSSPCTGLGLY